jgi:hypothetical protein
VNAVSLLGGVPVAVWIGLICSTLIPALSAVATRAPSFATGALTALLAGVNGVLSTLVATGDVTWKAAGAALLSWLIAAVTHSKVLAGTDVERQLHAIGTTAPKHPSPGPGTA